MTKRKLERYREIGDLENVIELEDYNPNTVSTHRGRWCEQVFGNDKPLWLELACGKGDYTLELARRYPEYNFIGVDVKGDRIWRGAVVADEEKLENVRFLRIYIDHIENYFGQAEVDGIWITFPDPYPGEKKSQKRLTSPTFLKRYRSILKPGALVHLKTDSKLLFDFTIEVVNDERLYADAIVFDVHNEPHREKDLDILTYYEKQHLQEGRTIRYVRFNPHKHMPG
jgi:tRNA (guanine-N7-)-methyltransferase